MGYSYIIMYLLDSFFNRIHSLRRSIRESFRQRRNTASTADRRKIAQSLNLETDQVHKKLSSKVPRPRASSEPTSPVTGASSGNDFQVIFSILHIL